MELFFLRLWYEKKISLISFALLPVACGFWLVSQLRKFIYTKLIKPKSTRVPIIVVGNITLGGVGKTPLVAAIYQRLLHEGYKPAIISRGYGRTTKDTRLVDAYATSQLVGDEPLMLYQMLQCPIAVAIKRTDGIDLIYQRHPEVNIIISDDGLQHYKLNRDIEIAVIDAKRQLGNGLIFPAGPLREPKARLNQVDFIIYNGKPDKVVVDTYTVMMLKPSKIINMKTNQFYQASDLIADTVYAVAGIGNPKRFFDTLTSMGYNVIEKPYPDHYQYQKKDLNYTPAFPIIMTAKDAVKCYSLANEHSWYLTVEASINQLFFSKLLEKLN
ncbi:tetraacyldisaccharide 4'-kinase [Thiotrichales bacterium 19S3-7]|nr:tetraacyldisaccharide 4'-kinase [Thiotrichales bacterium 19S3-7]MCF6801595.1 tetraacyldisaccharide 4'-kinase [Thiotrichales bacterium 19S3-11]